VESEKVKSMTAAESIPDQSVVLRGVRWETYERLLADHQDSSGARLNYDSGILEIMAPSFKHENLKETIASVFQLVAETKGIDFVAAGSTTFRRQDLRKGFEPDACFYVRDVARIRTLDEIDLSVDPPPDLVVEVVVTNRAVNKLPLFAALEIPEVWRYQEEEFQIFVLESKAYSSKATSSILPGVGSGALTELVQSSREIARPLWIQRVRDWARNT
jgi:Uma2 family endonuclease